MPVVSPDGPSFSDLAWTFKLLASKHTENQHLPLHFRCYCIASYEGKVK